MPETQPESPAPSDPPAKPLCQINERVRFVHLYTPGYDQPRYVVLKGKVIGHVYNQEAREWRYTLDPSDCGYWGHKHHSIPEGDLNPDYERLEKLARKHKVEISQYHFNSDSINVERKKEIENPAYKETEVEGYRILRASDMPAIHSAIAEEKAREVKPGENPGRAYHYTLLDENEQIIAFAVVKKSEKS